MQVLSQGRLNRFKDFNNRNTEGLEREKRIKRDRKRERESVKEREWGREWEREAERMWEREW